MQEKQTIIYIISLKYFREEINVICDSIENAKMKFIDLHLLHHEEDFDPSKITVEKITEIDVAPNHYWLRLNLNQRNKEAKAKRMAQPNKRDCNYYEHREMTCKCYNKRV